MRWWGWAILGTAQVIAGVIGWYVIPRTWAVVFHHW